MASPSDKMFLLVKMEWMPGRHNSVMFTVCSLDAKHCATVSRSKDMLISFSTPKWDGPAIYLEDMKLSWTSYLDQQNRVLGGVCFLSMAT